MLFFQITFSHTHLYSEVKALATYSARTASNVSSICADDCAFILLVGYCEAQNNEHQMLRHIQGAVNNLKTCLNNYHANIFDFSLSLCL
jgi:hypothetical protein